ncbi:hypothetical protein DSL72_001510 [Monilinia vaccinii-corymbosi]|uniref:Heterokaryon incompatibility domain-containing protein n=1 Tax=Monilinia vaccinii-corymbosi TaxID=61207 RepID=A0A8A3P7V2_9HELO|nr:hypothetical protein DSL72_001510 [Monilinia vaccinii-corymbosi]
MPSPYLELPLLHPAKQIRLLRLEPSPPESDTHHFSLAVHEFPDEARPSYVAISYTWGEAAPLLPVVVNGTRMRVRFNCWYALWQMRHHGITTYLWIDSLCIDQADDAEKNDQVAIMGSIYASALCVASCLGTGETIGMAPSALTSDDREARLARMRLRARFDQLPYFERVWIKQEIILARDIVLCYGLEKMSWENFDRVVNTRARPWEQHSGSEDSAYIEMFGASSDAESRDQPDYDDAARHEGDVARDETEMDSTTVQLCKHRSDATSGTFVDLVLRYRSAKSSNPRDKIYALLSLLPRDDVIRQNLVIDYGQPTFHLFHAIVRLVYASTDEDVDAGQKHRVLELIREWLAIDEKNPDMDNYLRSTRRSPPSDWVRASTSTSTSTSDLAGSWLPGFNPYITLDVVEIRHIRPDDARALNLQCQPEGYTPRRLLEHINTWRRDDEKWSWTDIDQLVPMQLTSAQVTFAWPDLHSDTSPGMREFLVHVDVRAGDCIATVVWGEKTEDWSDDTDRWRAAHAVFRTIGAEEEEGGTDEATSKAPSYQLHSWAIPVRQALTLLTPGAEEASHPQPHNPDHNHDHIQDININPTPAQLKLHHHDALIPLILNHKPLHALLYPSPATESSSLSTTMQIASPPPSNNQSSPKRGVVTRKRNAEYEYIRGILG